ncbi:DEAD/DEAH box helicase [Emticicia sp. CRIBPO]|uniref:DEAD/DEAH box helicase n=1 Tax=Emticicia sp. CRIBPO TaxID=2683258 RepID=UPI001E37472D|nr:DEAD/DEAH box helicase [Emticicia sp. CRIBPO]
MTFKDFSFVPELLDGLDAMGFEKPTPIQEQAIPLILDNQDLIACAQTGTGKTAAFVLPILHKIFSSDKRHLNTLIIAPTRELALQIDQQVEGLSYFLGVSSIPVYGGGDGETFVQQKRALEQGAELVIATPGRLIALLNSGQIKFNDLQHLVLDEADRMLDMGFFNDILKIISYLPAKRQTILFSATMPPNIRKLASKILTDPKQVNIAISKPAEGINQQAYVVYENQKKNLLKNILSNPDFKSIIVFASTKENVKTLEKELVYQDFEVKGFHSDLDQSEREKIMIGFKSKKTRILIGTDILSRGIDVEGIDLVINYDTPSDPEDYIHRIGRTARAESQGTAITFINEKDQRKFFRIESLIGKDIPKLEIPESLGKGPEYDPSKNRGDVKKKVFNKQKKNFKKRRPAENKNTPS